MRDVDHVIRLALDAGFSVAASLNCEAIRLRPEVREMCAADKCHTYAKNWSCPPGCGSLEDCTQRVSRYRNGVIVQTVGTLEDEFDFDGMAELVAKHNRLFSKFSKTLYTFYPDMLPLGAGGCQICSECTYPDEPCRFPEAAISSMEAYGMLVSEVCTDSKIPYYHGPGTMVYVGCFLLN